MGKNVAVFVDVANIFYAAKAAGVDIDYVTLLKAAIAGRDFVRAYAYTGLDPDNENQRNFHSFLSRHGYKVVSKDIRKYGDGKVKANLDIELVVDLMKTSRNLDVAIIVSGDGDFAPAIRAVQEMGVRCEVISFRGNTSSDLIEVADLFSDITQLAKVERSGRSGRRVADDEFDMSMTEVPDKQTEGTGAGRGGRGYAGRGRGRGRSTESEPREVAAAASGGGERARVDRSGGDRNGAAVIALPGEKLSGARAGRPVRPAPIDMDDIPVMRLEDDDEFKPAESDVAAATGGAEGDGELDGEGRRRRRRGGRGRGRGRSRAEEGAIHDGAVADLAPRDVAPREAAPRDVAPRDVAPREGNREPVAATERPRLPYEDEEPVPGPRGQRPTPFGSIWDSQLGVPAARPAGDLAPLPDEDEEEPEIPEYLLAERRGGRGGGGPQGGRGQMGGPGRGRSGAYAAALDRERYGGAGRGMAGGASGTRFQDPMGRQGQQGPGQQGPGRGPRPGGRPNERPDRDRFGDRGFRDDRGERAPLAPRPDRPGGRSEEPWSEVPPELEELLRAQVASRPRPQSAPQADDGGGRSDATGAGEADAVAAGSAGPAERGPGASTRGRGRRQATPVQVELTDDGAASASPASAGETEGAPAATRGRRRRPVEVEAGAEAGSLGSAPAASDASGGDGGDAPSVPAAPRRGRRPAEPPVTESGESSVEDAPTPRRGRRPAGAGTATAGTATAASDEASAPADVETSAPKRRVTRSRATATATDAPSDAPAPAGDAEGAAPAPRRGRRRTTETADQG